MAKPERVAVSTRNSKASFTTGRASESRTVPDRARDLSVRQRPHVPRDLLRPQHRTDPVAPVRTSTRSGTAARPIAASAVSGRVPPPRA